MLGKPQDCSLACKFSGPCFGHLSPDTHPKGRGDAIHHGTHLMKCGSCRETLLSLGLVVLGHTCRTGPVTLRSMRCLVEEGSPYFWGADSDSKAGPTQEQSLLWICAVPLLVLPTPSSTGRQQAELPRTWPLRQPAAGSHPTTLELEAVFPAPSKFQHSQKYRSSKGRQVSLRSP